MIKPASGACSTTTYNDEACIWGIFNHQTISGQLSIILESYPPPQLAVHLYIYTKKSSAQTMQPCTDTSFHGRHMISYMPAHSSCCLTGPKEDWSVLSPTRRRLLYMACRPPYEDKLRDVSSTFFISCESSTLLSLSLGWSSLLGV